MKNLFIATLFTFLCLNAFSQPPVVEYGDGHIRRHTEAIDTTSVNSRYQKAIDYVSKNKLNSEKLIKICSTLESQEKRFEIAKRAYKNITDKENFFEVYDVFTKMSLAIKLYHTTLAEQQIDDHNSKPIGNNELIKEKKSEVSKKEFMYHVRMVNNKTTDDEKVIVCKKLIERNKYNTQQITFLAEQIKEDLGRLDVIKAACVKLDSKEDRIQLKSVLQYRHSIKLYMDFLKTIK